MSENSVISAQENKANLPGRANGGHSPPYEFEDAPASSSGCPSCPIIPVFQHSIVPAPGGEGRTPRAKQSQFRRSGLSAGAAGRILGPM